MMRWYIRYTNYTTTTVLLPRRIVQLQWYGSRRRVSHRNPLPSSSTVDDPTYCHNRERATCFTNIVFFVFLLHGWNNLNLKFHGPAQGKGKGRGWQRIRFRLRRRRQSGTLVRVVVAMVSFVKWSCFNNDDVRGPFVVNNIRHFRSSDSAARGQETRTLAAVARNITEYINIFILYILYILCIHNTSVNAVYISVFLLIVIHVILSIFFICFLKENHSLYYIVTLSWVSSVCSLTKSRHCFFFLWLLRRRQRFFRHRLSSVLI